MCPFVSFHIHCSLFFSSHKRVGDEVMETIIPSHLSNDTTKKCVPASMALVVYGNCSRGKCDLLL